MPYHQIVNVRLLAWSSSHSSYLCLQSTPRCASNGITLFDHLLFLFANLVLGCQGHRYHGLDYTFRVALKRESLEFLASLPCTSSRLWWPESNFSTTSLALKVISGNRWSLNHTKKSGNSTTTIRSGFHLRRSDVPVLLCTRISLHLILTLADIRHAG